MIYKSILFSLFLAPVTMAGNNTKNARIQELEEKIFQKELEITNLENMIDEKDEFLSSFGSDSQALLRSLKDKRVKQLEKQNDGKALSQEDKSRIAEEVRNKTNDFLYKFADVLKDNKTIEGMLTEGFFQKDEDDDIIEFESLRFYLIRQFLNKLFLMRLVKKYEICITEYRALMNELIDLKK